MSLKQDDYDTVNGFELTQNKLAPAFFVNASATESWKDSQIAAGLYIRWESPTGNLTPK